MIPDDMLGELRRDNLEPIADFWAAQKHCDERGDVATISAIENGFDEADWRSWFFFAAIRRPDASS